MFFDCLVVKVRHEKRIINKSVYVALGIDLEGKKDVLGLWMSENDGAKFLLSNLTEMKNRGLLYLEGLESIRSFYFQSKLRTINLSLKRIRILTQIISITLDLISDPIIGAVSVS